MVAVATGTSLSDLVSGTALLGEERIAADFALSSDHTGAYVCERDDSLVFLCSDLSLLDLAPRIAEGLGATVSTAAFASVSDTWVWRVDGAGEPRLWVWSYGEEAANDGTPHPAEAGVFELDEDSLGAVLARATGVILDAALLHTPCQQIVWGSAA